MAQTFGAWLAGVPLGIARDRYYWAAHMDRVTFATWTFGRDFKLADHAAAFKQHRQRIQRAGGRGHWWIELQCRRAPHIHAYLAGLTEGCMARLHEQWLADPRVAATRAGPQGQYHEGMRAAEAAMAKEAGKVVQKAGWNGRYWGLHRPQGHGRGGATRRARGLRACLGHPHGLHHAQRHHPCVGQRAWPGSCPAGLWGTWSSGRLWSLSSTRTSSGCISRAVNGPWPTGNRASLPGKRAAACSAGIQIRPCPLGGTGSGTRGLAGRWSASSDSSGGTGRSHRASSASVHRPSWCSLWTGIGLREALTALGVDRGVRRHGRAIASISSGNGW